MAATEVLGASAARRESSSLSIPTIVRMRIRTRLGLMALSAVVTVG